ncbi:MAG: hypothetical protein M4579_002180 [Chaenotheca gracillima]|nr:MAG: hypothetical protein M4579_002180 [Chaenotheca gracillima]
MKQFMGLSGKWLTVWVTVSCTTAMALFGYDQGVFGGIIVTEDFLNQMGIADDTNMQGTVTSLYDVGCFFGALSGFSLGELLGRKRSILLGTVVMMVGAVLQVSSYGLPQMIVARIITGLGNGLNTASAPVWQSETSKASMRGRLVVLEMIMNIAGFSLANWMTYGFSFLNGSISWRFPLAFQLVFGFVLLSTVPWLPESPRWLIAHGKEEKAVEILAALEGDGATVNHPHVITEAKEIKYAIAVERENGVGWLQLLKGKAGVHGTCTIRRLILGAGTQAMQQLAGINVTSYYLPTVFIRSVGLDDTLARLLAACNSVSYLVFSFIAIPKVETWGRRRLMMYAAAGQSACYLVITILIKFANESEGKRKHDLGSASVTFFFLYYIFFGIGWQGVPWLYPTEINSLHMRTKGAALGTASNWGFNYMVVQITPIGIETLDWKFYIIWTVFNASFVPIVYLFYPETAGRRLEDIDRLYREDHSIWVFKNKEAIAPTRPVAYIDADEREMRRNSSVAGNKISGDYSNGDTGFTEREKV